jgi:hypothetical protein
VDVRSKEKPKCRANRLEMLLIWRRLPSEMVRTIPKSHPRNWQVTGIEDNCPNRACDPSHHDWILPTPNRPSGLARLSQSHRRVRDGSASKPTLASQRRRTSGQKRQHLLPNDLRKWPRATTLALARKQSRSIVGSLERAGSAKSSQMFCERKWREQNGPTRDHCSHYDDQIDLVRQVIS